MIWDWIGNNIGDDVRNTMNEMKKCKSGLKVEFDNSQEEVMKRRGYLIKKIPGLNEAVKVKWEKRPLKEDLEAMSELLRVNAIPTKSFDISCEEFSQGSRNWRMTR